MSSDKSFYSSLPPQEILFNDDRHSLRLRPLKEEDAFKAHFAVMESLPELLPFLDWAHEPSSVSAQRERIRRCFHDYILGTDYEFGVFDQTNQELLAFAGMRNAFCKNQNSLELGHWTRTPYQRKGLATLTMRILTVTAFTCFNCDRIVLGCNKANLASRQVIEKCGFQFEGEIRNYYNKPSEKMVKAGFTTERSYLQYALTPEEAVLLPWYPFIVAHMQIVPFVLPFTQQGALLSHA